MRTNCKVRVIPYRTKKGYSKPLQNRMALPTCAGTPTTAFPARTSSAPVFKPCLQTLKPESGYGHRQGHEPVRAKLLAGRVLHGNAVPSKGSAFYRCQRQCDSANGGMDNDFTPLRNLFNEWLVRDTSKKIKAVKRAKGMSGKPVTSKPVYGYLMDEDENYLVDEETAPVVQQIYQLCLAGNGPTRLPYAVGAANPHAGNAGIPQDGQHPPLPPGYECKWATNTVVHILENRSTPAVW